MDEQLQMCDISPTSNECQYDGDLDFLYNVHICIYSVFTISHASPLYVCHPVAHECDTVVVT